MAENKGILLAKSVQKHAGRAKEKLLQNLGKVDRTADEIFDEHLTNFNRQHTCATRLQKEFSNYIRCVRAVQSASKTLMDAIAEVYESQWTGSEALYGQTKAIDTQYQQFSYKLADQVLKQLDTYALQFPEMKKKIDKRGRKLVDYDSQRHSFQSLQANAAKRKDDVKVTRGREQLDEAKSTYEMLNSELHDELPALFDSRILFLVTNLQTLFACEQQFHSETSKVYADLEAIVDKLATESQRGSYTLKKTNANSNTSSPQQSPVKANLSIVNNVTNGSTNTNGHTSQNMSPVPRTPPQQQRSVQQEDDEPSYQNTEIVKAAAATTVHTTNGASSVNGKLETTGEGPSPALNCANSVSTPLPSAAKLENGNPEAPSTPIPAAAATRELTNGTVHPPHQQPRANQHRRLDESCPSNSIGSEKRQPRAIPEAGVSGTTAATTDVTAANADDTPLSTADADAVDVAAAAGAFAAAAALSTATPPTAGAAVSQTSNTNLHYHHPHHSHHHSHHPRSYENLQPVYQYRTDPPNRSSSSVAPASLRFTPVSPSSTATADMSTLSAYSSVGLLPFRAAGWGVERSDKVTQTSPPIIPMMKSLASSPLLTSSISATAAGSASTPRVNFANEPRANTFIGNSKGAAVPAGYASGYVGGGMASAGTSIQYPNYPSSVLAHSHDHQYSQQHHAAGSHLNTLNNNRNFPNTNTNRSLFGTVQQQLQDRHYVSLNNNNKKLEIVYAIPVGATTADLPAGVLYRVKATYKYVREDVDELSFEVGDVINVVEYEDPEDQEEGWLMGLKEGTTERGMFPANFTRPL